MVSRHVWLALLRPQKCWLGLLKLLLFVFSVRAFSWTATPFNPAAIPLAVRTPYLSAWLPQGTGAALNDVWPTFWTGQVSTLTFTRAFIRITSSSIRSLVGPDLSRLTACRTVFSEHPASQGHLSTRLRRKVSQYVNFIISYRLILTAALVHCDAEHLCAVSWPS